MFDVFRPLSLSMRVRRAGILAFAGLAAAPFGASAQSDRIIDTPTGWEFYYGINSSGLDGRLAAGMRPFFLSRVGSDSYDAIFVSNVGAYAQTGTAFTFGVTPSTLATSLAITGRRPLTLQARSTLMYGITVPNSGGTAAAGAVYTSAQPNATALINWATANNVRVIDFDKNPTTGEYSGIGVSNTGAHAQSWWWYFGVTESQVVQFLTQNSARLIDVIVENGGAATPTFSVIMVGQNPGMGLINLSATQTDISNLVNYNKTRVTVMERYTNSGGQTRWAVALVDNASTEERRIRGIMNAYNGIKAFARKRVGGGFELTLNENYAVEPASSMKIVHSAYAMTRIAAGAATLTTQTYNRSTCGPTSSTWNNACPDNVTTCSPGDLTLAETIRRTMQSSDNMCTEALERFAGGGDPLAGRAVLNNWMAGLGFTSHNINHTLGCLCGQTPNVMTAAEFCRFYEMIDNGSLLSAALQDDLYERMSRWSGSNGTVSTIITNEAAGTSLTSSEIAEFRSRFDAAAKAGGYGCSGQEWRGYAGRISIPTRGNFNGLPLYGAQEHAGAMFVQDTNSANASDVYTHYWELYREPIRQALESWDAGCTPPTISPQPQDLTRNLGQSATFTANVGGTNLSRSMQWFASPTGSAPWTPLTNAGRVSGATSNSLTLSSLLSTDSGYYRLTVTSACGSVTSTAARLTVVACRVDLNGDGTVDFNDFLSFMNLFNTQDPRADFNDDGTIDFNDFLEFLNQFNQGC